MKIVTPEDEGFWDPREFLPMLSVRAKSGGIKPFNLWDHQKILALAVLRAYDERKWIAHIKPRQEGSSTFFTGVAYQHTAYRRGCRAALLAHKRDTASYLSSVAIRFHQYTPKQIKQKKTPGLKRTLEFPSLDSRMTIESVRSDEPLRGETVQMLLATEISAWEERSGADAWTAALSAVPDEGGMVIAESTPRFHGDQMHQISMASEVPGSKWLKVFVPWTMVSTYVMKPPPGWTPRPEVLDYANKYGITKEQACWMQLSGLERCRRDLNKFQAEYPIDEVECWRNVGDAVFNTDVLAAMLKDIDGGTGIVSETKEFVRYQNIDSNRRYIIAVDPASSWSKRDYTAAVVMDIDNCCVVADFLGHKEAYKMANWLCEIGKEYNDASIYVEANGVGEAVLSHLVTIGYSRIFHRKSSNTHRRGGGQRVPGWYSAVQSKSESISILQRIIDDGSLTIPSRRCIQQLLHYRGQWDGLQRDVVGGHYDLAAALSICAWGWRNECGKREMSSSDKAQLSKKAWDNLLRKLDGGGSKWNSRWGQHL